MRTLLGFTVIFSAAGLAAAQSLSLAGQWAFELDPDDRGHQEQWQTRDLPDAIALPGSTDTNGYGAAPEKPELTRLTRRHKYIGRAWYQREIVVPDDWEGKAVFLFLERCHWKTEAWLNGVALGENNSLVAPHVYRLPDGLEPGPHRLTLCVDNRKQVEIGDWAASITAETQTMWNGITGRIELQARPRIRVEDVTIWPDAHSRRVRLDVDIVNETVEPSQIALGVVIETRDQAAMMPVEQRRELSLKPGTMSIAIEVNLPENAPLWDEFHPDLLQCTVSLRTVGQGPAIVDQASERFGLRDLGATRHKFTINGRVVHMRGDIDAAQFPLTGYPPTSVEAWRDFFRQQREWGMNHVRFHSWTPPKAAFAAADELGMMLQVEAPIWVGLGNISDDPTLAAFLRAEAEAMLDLYGNHPSFCLMTLGNELGHGEDPVLLELVAGFQKRDPRRGYTTTARKYSDRIEDDYCQGIMIDESYGFEDNFLRAQKRIVWHEPETTFDYEALVEVADIPIISHENGQYCQYPDYDNIKHYTGALFPMNYEQFQASLEESGLADQAGDFFRASGALAIAMYKFEIETNLRSPSMAGFQLLGLSDFQGWGSALIGVLDALRRPKGHIAPEQWRRFCSPTVPLLRMPRRTWTTDQTFHATAEVAHYGPADLVADAQWTVRDDGGRLIARGDFPQARLVTGGNTPLGEVNLPLADFPAPDRFVFEIILPDGTAANDWDFWVFPERVDTAAPDNVQVAHRWSEDTKAHLRNGDRVVLLLDPDTLHNSVQARLAPVFWSYGLFPNQPRAVGQLSDPTHPALSAFPTQFHSDWQWWDLIKRSRSLVIDDLPPELMPIVQPIDSCQVNSRLASVIEAKVLGGSLLVCSMDLFSDLDDRPAARQLRHSLLRYAAGAAFTPEVAVTEAQLDALLAAPSFDADAQPPVEASQVILHIRAGSEKKAPGPDTPWPDTVDDVVKSTEDFGYSVWGQAGVIEGKPLWMANTLAVMVTCPPQFEGALWVRLEDPDREERATAMWLNGKDLGPCHVPSERGTWVKADIDRKVSAMGTVVFEMKTINGPNTAASAFVLVADTDGSEQR